MKMLVTALCAAALVVALAACGQSNGSAGAPVDVDIAVRTEPETLAVGELTLIVELSEPSGAPVDGANVTAVGTMDHEGMEAVEGQSNDSVDGEYRIPFAWTMGGGWTVTVTVDLPDGRTASDSFDYFVEAVSSQSVINRAQTSQPASDQLQIAYESGSVPAHLGDAVLMFIVTDAAGEPIADATVSVRGDMAHAGMMPVSGTGTHTGDGQYTVPIRWTMVGEWQVTVTVARPDGREFEHVFDQQVVIE